jgi:PAS domain S-box-containing protein
MFETDLSQIVEGTADAAFGVSLEGEIRFWNVAAEDFFGCPAAAAVGRSCCDLVCGTVSSDGGLIQAGCPVLQRAAQGVATPSFDLEVRTNNGPRWANVSTILAPTRRETYVLHLARDVQVRKQIEKVTRAFLSQIGAITGLTLEQLLSSAAVPHLDLTAQETAILRLLVEGRSTREIGDALHVSSATVRNHVEHILRKLQAHSRLEAVLRAIREKLV